MSNTPIKWRLRGMLELDYVLLSFYDACYEDLTAAQKHSFSLTRRARSAFVRMANLQRAM